MRCLIKKNFKFVLKMNKSTERFFLSSKTGFTCPIAVLYDEFAFIVSLTHRSLLFCNSLSSLSNWKTFPVQQVLLNKMTG